jgi:hypothetical protein
MHRPRSACVSASAQPSGGTTTVCSGLAAQALLRWAHHVCPLFAIVLGMAVAGCGRPGEVVASAGTPPENRVNPRSDVDQLNNGLVAWPIAPAEDAELEFWLSTYRRVSSPRTWAWLQPLPAFGPPRWTAPASRPFPGARFSAVRAYNRGFDERYLNLGESHVDREVAGCPGGGGVFAANGRFCPSVVLPGVLLNEEHVQMVLAVVAALPEPNSAPRQAVCGTASHIAFVFFDDETPIAQVNLGDEDCPFVSVHGGAEHLYPFSTVQPEDEELLMALVRLAGQLSLYPYGRPPDEVLLRQAEQDGTVLWRKRRTDYDPGVPLHTPLNALTSVQKQQLCLWHVKTDRELPRHECTSCGEGFELCGVPIYEDCVEHFPRCSTSVEELLSCERLAFDNACRIGSVERCKQARNCLLSGIGASRRGTETTR